MPDGTFAVCRWASPSASLGSAKCQALALVIPKGLSALASSVVLQPPAPLREHFQDAGLTPTTTPTSSKMGFSWRKQFPSLENLEILSAGPEAPFSAF